MTPWDIGLFLKSARTDATIMRLRTDVGEQQAFDAVYDNGDPWAANDPRYLYQRRKYEVLDGLLPKRDYRRALDLGCGVGHLARRLAKRVDSVLGVDISNSAIATADTMSADVHNLTFDRVDALNIPSSFDGQFDLITIADTLYYLPPPIADATFAAIAARVSQLLVPDGVLLLANHFVLGFDKDSRLSRRIHNAFKSCSELRLLSEHRRPFYLTSIFTTS